MSVIKTESIKVSKTRSWVEVLLKKAISKGTNDAVYSRSRTIIKFQFYLNFDSGKTTHLSGLVYTS